MELFVRNVVGLRPFCGSLSLSVVFQDPTAPSITSLFFPRRPLNISRSVRTFIVYPLQSVLRGRGSAHVEDAQTGFAAACLKIPGFMECINGSRTALATTECMRMIEWYTSNRVVYE